MRNFFYSMRFFSTLLFFWTACVIAALVWLQGSHLYWRLPIQTRFVQPSGVGPNSYIVSMGTDKLSKNDIVDSPAILLEDGRPLGPGNALFAQIGELGAGRFSFWKGSLIFSSSDNSDPRANGRSYALILPGAAPDWLGAVLLLLLLSLAWFVWHYFDILKDRIYISPWQALGSLVFGLAAASYYIVYFLESSQLDLFLRAMIFFHLAGLFSVLAQRAHLGYQRFPHPLLFFCSLFLIVIFLITRLPFFIHYPLVRLVGDTGTYLVSMKLGLRPPGYPLFIWLITNMIDRWMAVIGVQSLLFLVAVLSLIYGVYSLRRSLALPATLAMAGFLGSSQVLIYETTAMPESLYTTCLIFIFAFLLLGIVQSRMRYFVLSSLSIGMLLSFRYAGMFMIVVYVAILLYVVWNKYKPRLILGFLFPLLLMLFFWSAYNYFTLGKFGMSSNPAYNMGGATVWFWEPDQSFPPAVNDMLRELPSEIKAIGITDADQAVLMNSWNPEELFPIFARIYNPLVGTGWTGLNFANLSDQSAESIVKMVIITSTKKHPDLYAKFAWTNMYVFFKTSGLKWDFYGDMTERARAWAYYTGVDDAIRAPGEFFSSFYQHPKWPDGEFDKEYFNLSHLNFVSIVRSDDTTTTITLMDSPFKRVHIALQTLQWAVFQQRFWFFAFIIVSLASTLKLLASKGRHPGAFILFIMAITVIGASLIVSISELALERYSYPTQFIYYLTAVLSPLLWLSDENSTDGGLKSDIAMMNRSLVGSLVFFLAGLEYGFRSIEKIMFVIQKAAFIVKQVLTSGLILLRVSMAVKSKAAMRNRWLAWCLVFLLAGLGYYYHPSDVFWIKQAINKGGITQDERGDKGYVAFIGFEKYSSKEDYKSTALLFEDEKELGPSNASFDRIARRGLGRYMFWDGTLYFSTSDSSDPRENGRNYELAIPFQIHYFWQVVFGLLGFYLIFWLIVPQGLITVIIEKTVIIVGKIKTFIKKVLIFGFSLSRNSFVRSAALIAPSLSILWLYGFHGPDWEMLTTKHYWQGDSQWYYGGYAAQFEETADGYRTIQREGLVNFYNLFPFSEKNGPLQAQYQVGGFPSTERLAVPFLGYIIIGLTRGFLDVWNVFYFLNIVIWLSSIFLVYQIASIYFKDSNSPIFAALFVVFYPAFTLNFHGLKLAYINTLFLLAGIYAFEKNIRHTRVYLQFLYFSALFFFGLFAAGGWLFLFIYLFIRHFSLPRPQRWSGVAVMMLALLVAQIALGYLRLAYHLPQAEQQMSFSYGKTLSDSMKWLQIWVRGQGVGDLKFLNYAGYSLFTGYIPLIIRSFFLGHWALLLLSLPGWIVDRRTRIFLVAFILLLSAGHGGYMITGWSFHYGYLSAPAAMMLILTASGFLGWLVSRPQLGLKVLTVALIALAIFGFANQKLWVGLYYGGYGQFTEMYQTRIILHYGGSSDVIEY